MYLVLIKIKLALFMSFPSLQPVLFTLVNNVKVVQWPIDIVFIPIDKNLTLSRSSHRYGKPKACTSNQNSRFHELAYNNAIEKNTMTKFYPNSLDQFQLNFLGWKGLKFLQINDDLITIMKVMVFFS